MRVPPSASSEQDALIWRFTLDSVEKELEDEPLEEQGGAETIEHGSAARWRRLHLEHEGLRRELERIEARLAAGQPFAGELAALLVRLRRHLDAEGEAELVAACQDVPAGD